MTETPLAGTQAAPHSPPAVASPTQHQPPNGHAQTPATDEEPYTIKCICGFEDDDGNTVLCDGCDTWQHIDCYFPSQLVPDIHNCADCGPVYVNVAAAIEVQRRRREQDTAGHRKPRRTPAKSHKRKPREPNHFDAHANGGPESGKHAGQPASERKNGAGKDNAPPHKRARISHRASNSVASQADKRGAGGRRKAAVPSQRGASSPDSISEMNSPSAVDSHNPFSPEFLRLQDEDPGDSPLQANLFSNIAITGIMATWIQDADAVRAVTNGHAPGEVFQRVDGAFELLPLPEVVKRTKQDRSVEYRGRHPTWHFLAVNSFVPNGGLVGEIKGQVGHLGDYYDNPSNRWPYLRHPEPFVFFHPQLPIYIDTRREGTRCRYIRRSCRPNVVMKTLISNGTEYHFCLCAIGDLDPGMEITIGWELDAEIRNLLGRALTGSAFLSHVKSESLTPPESDQISDWAERVLSNHGGCACEDPQLCALARLDRRKVDGPLAGIQQWPEGAKRGKGRAARNQGSPMNMDRAEHSRAGSEGLLIRDRRDDNDESRSTSGSFRSKPQSRDITPLTHFSGEMPSTAPGTELSDREKRKIAAVERTFEQQENQNNTQKRKRRNPGGSALVTPGLATPVTSPSQFMAGPNCIVNKQELGELLKTENSDPDWIGRQDQSLSTDSSLRSGFQKLGLCTSSSSSAGSSLNSKVRNLTLGSTPYADTPVQTILEEDVSQHQRLQILQRKHKCPVSLTRRLLMRCPRERPKSVTGVRAAGTVHDGSAGSPSAGSDTCAVAGAQLYQSAGVLPSFPQIRSGESSNRSAIHQIDPNVQKPRPPDPPLVGVDSNSIDQSVTPIKPPLAPPPERRSLNLRVQLPPTPQYSSISPSTPSSAAGSMAHSPTGHNHLPVLFSPSVGSAQPVPTPVKKKLSLSDYFNRKNRIETPSVEKPPSLETSAPSLAPAKPTSSPADKTTKQEGPAETMKQNSEPVSVSLTMADS